ncbi:FixH protein [Arenibacter nanhaiticus]|uniref:FixH protein n=1 Tax=Arenibacter nanhaiticus TaxID=558155 RepID=A0A1M6IL19_9FLAO|nr:FixH family protein [Arenibacter nanhaiticus]SHJ35138.1 FixH protein [Arenibacter nanhaiticus]
MKINWGTSIVLAFIAFISFILFFVVRMSMDDRTNHDLVTEEYYKTELGFQKEIDAENNANKHKQTIRIVKTTEGLLLQFPNTINPSEVTGKVFLYRPSNKHLDYNFPLRLSEAKVLIPNKRMVEGRWDIKIAWEHKGEVFMHKEKITY